MQDEQPASGGDMIRAVLLTERHADLQRIVVLAVLLQALHELLIGCCRQGLL